MMLSNLHTHSLYSDGRNSLEELVEAALEKGFVSLGFSEHAPMGFEDGCSIPEEKIGDYLAEVGRLKQKYSGQIELYAGMERDALDILGAPELDYSIGSVHFLRDPKNGQIHTVDHTPELFEAAIDRIGGGSPEKLIKAYFSLMADMLESRCPDILGHLDLFVKLNQGDRFFDENAVWYQSACKEIADGIAASGVIVEVNTGGIARGCRSRPYPSAEILKLLLDRHVPVTISSDAHQAKDLDFWFAEAHDLLLDVGYRSIKIMQGCCFVDTDL